MKTKLTVMFALVFSATVATVTVSDDTPPAVSEALSDKVRGFLKKEMRLLAESGRAVEAAIAAGNSGEVKKRAEAMRENFVHKDEVTTFDLREIEAALGVDFVEQDKAFHASARALEAAAKAGDKAGQRHIFNQMLEACAACHAAYAPEAPVLE